MIKRVCWNITNRCNDSCPFCFRDKERDSLTFEQNAIIASKLIAGKINHIAFSGGEALLYKDLFKIVEMFKKEAISTTLISNGILLKNRELLDCCANTFDWLSIPMDSMTYMDGITRNKNHISNIVSILDYLEKRQFVKVKINTVVSHQNYKDILSIYNNIIEKYSCIKRWNLFEFTPLRGSSIEEKDTFLLNELEDQFVINSLHSIVISKDDLLVKYKHKNTIAESYFVISPNGDICNSKHNKIGNLLYDNIADICTLLDIDMDLYTKRTMDNKLIIV